MATIDDLQQQLAALTARVDTITTPPTDYYTSRYSGEEADNGIARALPGGEIDRIRPNRNLLDNWDFRNVVNQRGQAAYTMKSGYTFDRWYLENGTLTVDADGITLYTAASGNTVFYQSIPLEKIITGRVHTLSVMAKDGYINSSQATVPPTFMVDGAGRVAIGNGWYFDFYSNAWLVSTGRIIFRLFAPSGTSAFGIKAVKLELGSVSTLANDPPADYGTELAKCQRYQFSYFREDGYQGYTGPLQAMGAQVAYGMLYTPVTLRTIPAVLVSDYSKIYHWNPGGDMLSVTGIRAIGLTNNGVQIEVIFSGALPAGYCGWLFGNPPSSDLLILDANI